jgi:hypothetical protein
MPDDFSDDFRLSFPCGVLVNKDCVTRKNGVSQFIGDPLWLCIASNMGQGALPVFADEGAATRFCVASNLVGEVTMMVVEDGKKLVQILTQVAEDYGIEEVAINPEKATGFASRFWPIEHAIEQLKRNGATLH